MERLKAKIRTIPDFPRKGVLFRDITPVLCDGQLFRFVVTLLSQRYHRKNVQKVVAIDARGFLLGGAVAHVLGAGVVPVRKGGKLPYKRYELAYELEYGSEVLAVHQDAILPGERVVIIDDVLATGGTSVTTAKLVQTCGGQILELAFLVELLGLGGRERLGNLPYCALIQL
ncbi:adenine phosphoribosyltransferase [Candidatus Methylacidithermus pantelleriae]|uniref:adenine phosphoribosyltransferase n=1 Tax=Candidatus Methylacidithermus pantelleriae TaxID=2744239 RepID=UPI00157D3E13